MTTQNPQAQSHYNVLDAGDGAFVKAWTRGVPLEGRAEEQLKQVARLPFIHKWVAAMPDVHVGTGRRMYERACRAE